MCEISSWLVQIWCVYMS